MAAQQAEASAEREAEDLRQALAADPGGVGTLGERLVQAEAKASEAAKVSTLAVVSSLLSQAEREIKAQEKQVAASAAAQQSEMSAMRAQLRDAEESAAEIALMRQRISQCAEAAAAAALECTRLALLKSQAEAAAQEVAHSNEEQRRAAEERSRADEALKAALLAQVSQNEARFAALERQTQRLFFCRNDEFKSKYECNL